MLFPCAFTEILMPSPAVEEGEASAGFGASSGTGASPAEFDVFGTTVFGAASGTGASPAVGEEDAEEASSDTSTSLGSTLVV